MSKRLKFKFFMVYSGSLPPVVYVGCEPMLWSLAVKTLGHAVRAMTGKAPRFGDETWIGGVEQECATEEAERAGFETERAKGKYHCILLKANGTFELTEPAKV